MEAMITETGRSPSSTTRPPMVRGSETMRPLRVVHLDDEPFELERFGNALEKSSFDCQFIVESFSNVDEYRSRIAELPAPDVAILDIHIDAAIRGGVSLVEETRRGNPSVVILMCSAMDDVATIAECLSLGADDFLSKKSDRRELPLRVFSAYKLASLKRGFSDTVQPATACTSSDRKKPNFVGQTFEKLARRIPNVVNSAISAVHVSGESGTGKEMVADLFAYHLGDHVPFIRVNCGAITPSLLESELFGHVKGAFTGALSDKGGLIEAATGGWIFLDEVASLSTSAQVALLRVLENQELLRVGATKPRPINVRVLSATNEPLPAMVKASKFRKDLWQRLCETEFSLLPLRERTEEVEDLVRHFCASMPGGPYQISEPALDVLSSLPWKQGNIRELRNCLRAMTELHVNKLLTPLSIPERIWKQIEETQEEEGLERSQAAGMDPEEAGSEDLRENKERKSTSFRSSDEIVIAIDGTKPISFDALSDMLLLELTRKLTEKKGKLSLRQLAKAIGISRSTLSGRLKGLVHKNLIPLDELVNLVGLGAK